MATVVTTMAATELQTWDDGCQLVLELVFSLLAQRKGATFDRTVGLRV